MDYSNSFLSLLVPICIIAMVITTKRVWLSLLCGIVLGGFLMHFGDGIGSVVFYIYHSITQTVYDYSQKDGFSVNVWNLQVFVFLIFLGIITQLMLKSGGIAAFVAWAKKRVKTSTGAEFIAFFAGVIIFIDDYFNALTVGQISKNLIDANKSTRERLAYIIDSTSAPICILVPISSWGAYILGLLRDTKGMGEPLEMLIGSMTYNFYAWLTLLCVILTIIWHVNLGPMKKALPREEEPVCESICKNGTIYMLILPIISLFISILALIFITGYLECHSTQFFIVLKNANTAAALFYGGLISLIVTILVCKSYKNPLKMQAHFIEGFKIMLPAIIILLLAWAIGPVIRDDLKTGLYLANMSKTFLGDAQVFLIPAVIFICSGVIGFSTGTSWGTFAIMMPIVANISVAMGLDHNFLLMGIASVLAGAVYGDHTSPISDTTILSATGADCNVHAHFVTQLPYTTMVAVLSFVALVITAYTQNVGLGYAFSIVLMIGYLFGKRKRRSSVEA